MREAVDFLLGHVERHGDSQASEKAKQHREKLAAESAESEKLGGEPDATGQPELEAE